MNKATASEKIGRFVESMRADSVSPEVVHEVARAFVDTFGVALAGRDEPASRIVRDYAVAEGCGGAGTIWATGERVRTEDAALANATMVHVLDYDDITSMPYRGHPSSVMFPALVALGEMEGFTGADISTAYAVGIEVLMRLPQTMVFSHYTHGWHSTSTICLIAAAAACANALKLNAEQAAAAVGIAVAHVGGVHKSFGTMCKSIQPANAAAAAMRCARLASRGFTSPIDALDGHIGFTEVYAKGEDLHEGFDRLGEPPLRLLSGSLGVKRFPACHCALRAAQGVLDLLLEHPFDPEEVERVRVTVEPGGLTPLIHKRPRRGLEGKFSMEYAVAASILDRALGLLSFTDEAVQRPNAQALLAKVDTFEEESEPTRRRASVEVRLRNGETLSKRVVALRGSATAPLSDAELEAKFRDCVAFSGVRMEVEGFLSAVWDWRDRPVREVLRHAPSA